MYKIAIVGKAGSGKDTTAKIITKLINKYHKTKLKAAKFAFADPIKKMAKTMFPTIKNKHLFGPSKFREEIILGALDENDIPLTVRKVLLDLGTKGRSYTSMCWIWNMGERIHKAVSKEKQIILITDVRFVEEFDFLRKLGFLLINVKRNGEKEINHESETNQNKIDDYDFVLNNDGTLTDLKKVIKSNLIPFITKKQSIAE